MASFNEAFDKFEIWKNSHTPLKLTSVTKDGVVERLRGEISGIDFQRGVIAFTDTASRSLHLYTLREFSFSIGKVSIEAELRGDVVTLEEVVRITKWRANLT